MRVSGFLPTRKANRMTPFERLTRLQFSQLSVLRAIRKQCDSLGLFTCMDMVRPEHGSSAMIVELPKDGGRITVTVEASLTPTNTITMSIAVGTFSDFQCFSDHETACRQIVTLAGKAI